MLLLFIHGWSVTSTGTYGDLARDLTRAGVEAGLDLDIRHVFLGRYVSFRDEITMDDLARALDYAIRHDVPDNVDGRRPFSCITHSTGGPVVREWLQRFYGPEGLGRAPLNHLVMLAPANHGSALAVLGKGRLGRIKAWFDGIEPGQRILDWLCLGSDGQSGLDAIEAAYDWPASGCYPFVLTGETIDRRLYDYLNPYTGEIGSDGVVRVASANMNHVRHCLVQTDEVIRPALGATRLQLASTTRVDQLPMKLIDDASHSGKRHGIMAGVEAGDTGKPVVRAILDCLKVDSAAGFGRLANAFRAGLDDLRRTTRACMQLVVGVADDRGETIYDYDFYLLAGRRYSPGDLPEDFFIDRQMNPASGRLVYYLDAGRMAEISGGRLGIRIVARPEAGLSGYRPAEIQLEPEQLAEFVTPDHTLWLDIHLTRVVDRNVFRFAPGDNRRDDFSRTRASGERIG